MEDSERKTKAEWSVVVFTARESVDVVWSTLRAAVLAVQDKSAIIDVVVNGNPKLAQEVRRKTDELPSSAAGDAEVRVWQIALGDKANAINQYLYEIWPESELAFFVDGYVQVLPDALNVISGSISKSDHFLAATGVPQQGWSAAKLKQKMLEHGGIHGNLFALKKTAVERLRQSGFRLPRGIYRTDPTMGTVLAFNLDATSNQFDISRILVESNASWNLPSQSTFSASKLRSQFKRAIRQAQGDLENSAVRDHFAIRKRAPDELPDTVLELVESWLKRASFKDKRVFLSNPLSIYALSKLRDQSADYSIDATPHRVI